MSDYQKWLIGELMKGFSILDISEETGKRRPTLRAELNDAIEKIVYRNNQRFKECMAKKVSNINDSVH